MARKRRRSRLSLGRAQQILESELLAGEVTFNREYEKRFAKPKDSLMVR